MAQPDLEVTEQPVRQAVCRADRLSRRWLYAGPAVLGAALLVYTTIYLHWPTSIDQIDVKVYRFGASRIVKGLDLYSTGLTGNSHDLLFDYTPFAALCFIPLTFLGDKATETLWLTINCVAVICAVRCMVAACGDADRNSQWSLTALGVGLAACLEPVRLSLQLGQINLIILAIVAADLLGLRASRWAGIGIGLVAGLKLTPALFIVFLVAVGRLRAAVVAACAAVVTIVIGFVALPADSKYFWLRGGFHDVARISRDPQANASLPGLLVRLHVAPPLITAAAVLLAAVAVALAVAAYRRGQRILALAIVGMASAAASPFSWSHHWVWFVPLLIHFAYRAAILGCRASAWTMWVLSAFLAAWITSSKRDDFEAGVLSLHPGGMWTDVLGGAYVFVLLAVLAGITVQILRRPRALGALDGNDSRSGLDDQALERLAGVAQ